MPNFSMAISNDGTATTYDAQIYNSHRGHFRTIIRKEQMDSLKTLLQNAEVFILDDNYSTIVTDHPRYTLTIKDKNGRVKTIEDYGPSGPDELEKIYDLIFSFRDAQSWK
nr:DUF6438 domain-containing protein [Flavihumibacter petaseus]